MLSTTPAPPMPHPDSWAFGPMFPGVNYIRERLREQAEAALTFPEIDPSLIPAKENA